MSSSIPLPGSQLRHLAGSTYAGEPPPDNLVQVTVVLHRKQAVPELSDSAAALEYAEFAERHGADPAAIAAVAAFASEHHLSIVDIHSASRTITLRGRSADISAAFGIESGLPYRLPHIQIPQCLSGSVAAVLGLDQRRAANTYYCLKPRTAASLSYNPRQLAEIYNFPKNTGKNQTIALIELGGGFRNSDLKHYWKRVGVPQVSVTAVSVGGAHNEPTGDPNGPDGEVVLDIEVAGAVAPGARIAVYFAPNTDQGFLEALNAAIHDRVRKPSVISISWGAPESDWTPQAMNAFNAALHDAALLGISVCVAAGDNGSSDGADDGANHADFPASSPWVLACGGTSLLASNGKIQTETVWNDGTNAGATGGGVSAHFSQPSYQAGYNIPAPQGTTNPTGRGVPDISAVADPATGYTVLVDGTEAVVGGTSAVAPLWAGLIALMNEQLGKNLGWFHPLLYGTIAQHKALNDVTSGTNGGFNAGNGWDPCTGLGSPNGQAILDVLKSLSTK